jgi:hypothetical protein
MWSLVGTTSRILAQKLSASLRLMIRSLFSLFQFLLDFPKQRMHIIHFYHQATLLCFRKWLLLTRLPDSARVSLISSQYPTWCQSTLEPCGHDLNHVFLYPSCSTIQEKVTSNRADDRFSLEVLTPRVRCQPQLWIWRQFFST